MATVPPYTTFVDGSVIDAADFNTTFTTFKSFLENANMDTDNLSTKWAVYPIVWTINSDVTPAAAQTFIERSCVRLPTVSGIDKLISATLASDDLTTGTMDAVLYKGAAGTYAGHGLAFGAGASAITGVLQNTGAPNVPTHTTYTFLTPSIAANQELLVQWTATAAATGVANRRMSFTLTLWCATELKAL